MKFSYSIRDVCQLTACIAIVVASLQLWRKSSDATDRLRRIQTVQRHPDFGDSIAAMRLPVRVDGMTVFRVRYDRPATLRCDRTHNGDRSILCRVQLPQGNSTIRFGLINTNASSWVATVQTSGTSIQSKEMTDPRLPNLSLPTPRLVLGEMVLATMKCANSSTIRFVMLPDG